METLWVLLFLCPWSRQVIWLAIASWWRCGQTGFFDLSSHEFCVFWMRFDEVKQCLQELSWTPSTNQNERLAPFFSWYPTLICIFHFLVVTSLISTSSIEGNNLYFDILTITFWRRLYKLCHGSSVAAHFCVIDNFVRLMKKMCWLIDFEQINVIPQRFCIMNIIPIELISSL